MTLSAHPRPDTAVSWDHPSRSTLVRFLNSASVGTSVKSFRPGHPGEQSVPGVGEDGQGVVCRRDIGPG
jgi:hypothetical protein